MGIMENEMGTTILCILQVQERTTNNSDHDGENRSHLTQSNNYHGNTHSKKTRPF